MRQPAIPPEVEDWESIPLIIRNNYQRLKSMKGAGQLVIESPVQSFSASAQVLLNKPDSLLFKIEATFGIDVGWLFSRRNDFVFYAPQRNIYYTGSIDSLKMEDFIYVDLTYDRFIQAITGIELIPALEQAHLERDGDKIILSGVNHDVIFRYRIDANKGVVQHSEIKNLQGQVIVTAEYDRFARLGDVFVPRTIRLQRPLKRERFTLFYNRLIVNKEIDPKDFKTKIPDNALRVKI